MMDLKYSNGVQRRIKLEEELQMEYQSLLITQSEKVNQDSEYPCVISQVFFLKKSLESI